MTPSLVVDSSVAMAWCFLDEATPSTTNVLERMADEIALVPGLWFLEVTNVLFLAEKKGRIDANRAAEFIALIGSFQLEVDDAVSDRAFDRLLPFCRNHQLTSYDAVYLDLVVHRGLPLATLDEPLRKAAEELGVPLLGK